MAQTREIFLQKFEGQIEDIRDQFSARGLQDTMLEAMAKDLSALNGNVDFAMQEIAKAIRKLALLTPPDDLYAGVSDDRLYKMAMKEADNTENRARTAFNKLSEPLQNRDATRFFFYSEFKECCLNQIEYLRSELIRRIGPAAIDQKEMSYFSEPNFGIADMLPNVSISAVLEYVPMFRQLAAKLKLPDRPVGQ